MASAAAAAAAAYVEQHTVDPERRKRLDLERKIGDVITEGPSPTLLDSMAFWQKRGELDTLDLEAELDDLLVLDEYDEMNALSLYLRLEAAEAADNKNEINLVLRDLRAISLEYKERDSYRKQLMIEKKRKDQIAQSLVHRAVKRKRTGPKSSEKGEGVLDILDFQLEAQEELKTIRTQVRRRVRVDRNYVKSQRFARTILFKYLHY